MIKTIVYYKMGSYLPITENWIFNQINNLKRYQAIVYCHGTENLNVYPVEKNRSVKRTFFNLVWNKIFKFYPLFILYLLKDKPDLIHAHFGFSGYGFLQLKQMFKIPLFTSFYGQDLSMLPQQFPKWKKRYQQLFKEGDCFLIEGNHMKQSLVQLGCPEEKIIVQHLGVDLNKIKYSARKLRKNQAIKILISASFREKKGIPFAVEAFGMVKEKNPGLKLKLTIIGDSRGNNLGEMEKRKIFNKIKEYNLKDSITFLGYQSYLVFLDELYKHHIFISPSITASDGDTEGGIPVSLIEASASGMPVLSTTHCDIPEAILNGKSGYLVPERDSVALADKLDFLVSHTKIWGKMGKAGRSHIGENYDLKKQIKKLENIYDNTLLKR